MFGIRVGCPGTETRSIAVVRTLMSGRETWTANISVSLGDIRKDLYPNSTV